MNPRTVNEGLSRAMIATSGADDGRDYIGLSGISKCSLVLYREYTTGKRPHDESGHRNCKRGYALEGIVKDLLISQKMLKVADGYPIRRGKDFLTGYEREIVVPFDARVKGHTDGEFVDGDLLEIKSMPQSKLDAITQQNRIPAAAYWQVQAYMHFGGYRAAQVVALASDTFEHRVFLIAKNEIIIRQIESKLHMLLDAIDQKVQPPCECGRCFNGRK